MPKILTKKTAGDPLSAKDYNDLLDAINSMKIVSSHDVRASRVSGGQALTSVLRPIISNNNSLGTDDGSLLLLDEYANDVYYNVGEKVCYKPTGSDYYYTYTCLVSGMSGTTPSGANWNLDTEYTTSSLWVSGTTYSDTTIVQVSGNPFYTAVYQCSGTALSGISPPTTGWVFLDYMRYGIVEYPPKYLNVEYKIPFKIQIFNQDRYNPITHKLLRYLTQFIYTAKGVLYRVETITEEFNSQAVPDED